MILSPAGEIAGKTGYRPGGPKKYIAHLKEIIDEHKKEQKKAKKNKDK